MTLQLRMKNCNLVSRFVASFHPFPRSLPFTKAEEGCSAPTKLNFRLISDGSPQILWIQKAILPSHKLILALAKAESDRGDGGDVKKVSTSFCSVVCVVLEIMIIYVVCCLCIELHHQGKA